jgi:hypothetical protein
MFKLVEPRKNFGHARRRHLGNKIELATTGNISHPHAMQVKLAQTDTQCYLTMITVHLPSPCQGTFVLISFLPSSTTLTLLYTLFNLLHRYQEISLSSLLLLPPSYLTPLSLIFDIVVSTSSIIIPSSSLSLYFSSLSFIWSPYSLLHYLILSYVSHTLIHSSLLYSLYSS